MSEVIPIPLAGGNPERPEEARRLVAGLVAQEPWAAASLFRAHANAVRSLLRRILGTSDGVIDDLTQDVFLRAIEGAERIQNAAAIKGWLMRIAVFTAREHIRRQQRGRWLRLTGDSPETHAPESGDGVGEATRCVYEILQGMPADERVVFSLRMLAGMELEELALACDMSLSTARRRLASASKRFDKMAARYESLAPWRTDP